MTSTELPDSKAEFPDVGDSPDLPEFGDGKDAGALRTIGEVATALGIKQHVLRYWEEQFPTLRPLTRAGGRRYYRPDDVALVMRINHLLHHEGYTIKGAKQALKALNAAKRHVGVSRAVEGVSQGSRPVLAGSSPLSHGSEAPERASGDAAIPPDKILIGIRDRLAAALDD